MRRTHTGYGADGARTRTDIKSTELATQRVCQFHHSKTSIACFRGKGNQKICFAVVDVKAELLEALKSKVERIRGDGRIDG